MEENTGYQKAAKVTDWLKAIEGLTETQLHSRTHWCLKDSHLECTGYVIRTTGGGFRTSCTCPCHMELRPPTGRWSIIGLPKTETKDALPSVMEVIDTEIQK